MKEFQEHLEVYKSHWYQHFSRLIPSHEWGNNQLATDYLTKYWLPEEEYLEIWKPIQNKVFVKDKTLPDLIYYSDFELIIMNGGSLFIETDFILLQKCMKYIGEDYFVVIQTNQDSINGESGFRMKFPVNITWNELISGNYISAILLEMPINEYCVFGSGGSFGKYSANDYEKPLDIIGFKNELSLTFKEHFKQSKEEKVALLEWLPRYKGLVK